MRLREIGKHVAMGTEWVGVVAVWLMLVFTMIDVIGAKVFLRPLRGSTELVGFAQVVAIAGGLAMTLYLGRQIQLEFLVSKLPRPLRRIIHVLVSVLGLVLFAILSQQAILYGRSLAASGQISSTGHIPFYPFAYILGIFAAVAALYYIVELVDVLRGSGEETR